MSSRAVSTRDGSRVPSTARLLLGGALVLALGATLVLVLSDDARFLKLGIVAALWAALVGAFLAARFRRQVTDRADNVADMQQMYELELEREIAARREYELELEAEAKRKADEQSRQDIEALRKELGALRETLQTLLGGEVLVERFALQAQATRMRSLGDDAPQIAARSNTMKRLNPGQGHEQREQVVISAEPQTELMDRVPDRHQPPRRDSRPPKQRPQRPPRESERQVQIRQQRPREDPADPGSGWWEPVVQPGSEAQRRQDYHRPVAGDPARSLGEGLDLDWTPSWEREQARPPRAPQVSQPMPNPALQSQPMVPVAQPSQPMPVPQQSQPLPVQQPGRPPRPPKGAEPMTSRPMQRPAEAETRVQAPVSEQPTKVRQPVAEAPTKVRRPVADPPTTVNGLGVGQQTRPQAPAPEPPQPSVLEQQARVQALADELARVKAMSASPEPPARQAPAQEHSSRVVQPPPVEQGGGRRRADERTPESGGRRRAPEPAEQPSRHAEPQESGGRRRRPDDVPSWQDSMQAGSRSGSHAKPVPEPEPSGSHAEGKSVSELLAAYGNADNPRRRRRKDD